MIRTEEFEKQGIFIKPEFISKTECDTFLQLINNYRQNFAVTQVYRETKPIPLSYFVIDGEKVKSYLPKIQEFYSQVNQFINNLTSRKLCPLKDIQVGCNINITEQGGTYRWHYDRNAVTAILYLNQVEGGEIECYPNYRILLPQARYSRLQNFIDRIQQLNFIRYTFGKKIVVKPQPGLLLVMGGNKCLHSVCPVTEAKDRINIVMSYDLPNTSFAIKDQLNSYLYSSQDVAAGDPNYSYLDSSKQ